MRDNYGRNISYIRISVTDRCNLRCRYCMPEAGICKLEHSKILSFEEIIAIAEAASELGISKIRLTGGEPLVRRNITGLVSQLAGISGIEEVTLTTNGTLFAKKAKAFREGGLQRVNFSLDSLKPEKYDYITRGGRLEDAWQGILAAIEAGMHPVKINTVLIKGFNDDEILEFADLAYRFPLQIRFIEFMPVGDLLYWTPDKVITINEVKEIIKKYYRLLPTTQVGNGPAEQFDLQGGKGGIGFISPMSNHFCPKCNRVRLTAEGKLRNCLYDYHETDLKAALIQGMGREELRRLMAQAIGRKPERHHMDAGWGEDNNRKMYQIGG